MLDSEPNSGFQTVVLDRVHGAGRPGTVLVSGARVIDIFPAAGTCQKTAEQVNLPPFGGYPGIAYQQGLHLVKGFMGDNRLVGIVDAHPSLLRHSRSSRGRGTAPGGVAPRFGAVCREARQKKHLRGKILRKRIK